MNPRRGKFWFQFDQQMIIALSGLLAIGLLAVPSATLGGGSALSKQAVRIVAGLLAMGVMASIPYRFWHRRSMLLLIAILLGLGGVLIFGEELLGAKRQFIIKGFSVQPSEFAKLVVIIYVADWLSSRGEQIRQFNEGLIPFSIILGVVAGLVAGEPKVSAAVLIVAIAGSMFFAAGATWPQIGIAATVGGVSLTFIALQLGYPLERLKHFYWTMANPLVAGSYQTQTCLQALSNGRWFGVGLGDGIFKKEIPLRESDSIMAVVGEEMGLVGSLLVLCLMSWLVYRCFHTAIHAPDTMGMLLAAGVGIWLGTQAAVHIGVITSVLPNTGLTFPFISHGGSSVVACMAGTGLVTSVWRACIQEGTLDARDGLRRRDRRTRLSSAVGR